MQIAVETIIQAMGFVLQVVPVGTNIGLLHMMWAMSNGSFLKSRGAIHGALAESGFEAGEIRRSWAALGYGAWCIDELLTSWAQQVASGNQWRARRYEGYQVKSLDITAFWRPSLQGEVSKHYHRMAQKALPAMVFGIMSISGAIGDKRLPLLRVIVRCDANTSERDFRQQLLQQTAAQAALDEITVMDAGFTLAEVQANQVKRFVLRMAKNCTARRNLCRRAANAAGRKNMANRFGLLRASMAKSSWPPPPSPMSMASLLIRAGRFAIAPGISSSPVRPKSPPAIRPFRFMSIMIHFTPIHWC